MYAQALRPTSIVLMLFVSLAFCLLGGCGSNNPIVCGASGCCGSGDACAIPQYVVADGLSGQVAVFPVNPANGTLSAPTTFSGPASSLGMTTLSNEYLYASSPVSMSTGYVDAWSFNFANGALDPVNGSPFGLGPFSTAGGLATNNTTQVVYVADAGKIDALQITPTTGALTPLSGSPFPAGMGVYVAMDPLDRYVFSTDDTPPGSVWAFTTDSTGALANVSGSPFQAVPNSNTNTNPSQIVVDPAGHFVYVALTATNQVAGFSIGSSGALTPVPGSPFVTGNAPLCMAITNNSLYIGNTTDGTITGFTFDTTTGILTPAAGSPFSIPAGALTTNVTGAYLYVSGPQGMLVYSIDNGTGGLTQVGSPVPFAGATVLVFVL